MRVAGGEGRGCGERATSHRGVVLPRRLVSPRQGPTWVPKAPLSPTPCSGWAQSPGWLEDTSIHALYRALPIASNLGGFATSSGPPRLGSAMVGQKAQVRSVASHKGLSQGFHFSLCLGQVALASLGLSFSICEMEIIKPTPEGEERNEKKMPPKCMVV